MTATEGSPIEKRPHSDEPKKAQLEVTRFPSLRALSFIPHPSVKFVDAKPLGLRSTTPKPSQMQRFTKIQDHQSSEFLSDVMD